MGIDVRYPERHADFIERCHQAGQVRPTPLLLQYGAGDYNCLHQDLYGEHVFPLQLTILLSKPDKDFTGGEFVMTEQRPRMQSRPIVVPLRQGDGVVFAVHNRPVNGTRGVVSGQSPARRQPHPVGTPSYGRHHFPRRAVRPRHLGRLLFWWLERSRQSNPGEIITTLHAVGIAQVRLIFLLKCRITLSIFSCTENSHGRNCQGCKDGPAKNHSIYLTPPHGVLILKVTVLGLGLS